MPSRYRAVSFCDTPYITEAWQPHARDDWLHPLPMEIAENGEWVVDIKGSSGVVLNLRTKVSHHSQKEKYGITHKSPSSLQTGRRGVLLIVKGAAKLAGISNLSPLSAKGLRKCFSKSNH